MPGSSGWALPAQPGGLGLIPVSGMGSLHPFSHAKALLIHNPIREVGGQKRAAKACSGEECWAAWRTQAELRCSQGEESCGQSTRRLPGRSSSIPADPAELHSHRHRSLEPMECCLYLTHLQIRGKHWCLTYTSYFYLRMGRGSCWIRRSHPWLNDQWQKHDLTIKECSKSGNALISSWCRWKSALPWSTMMALSHQYFLMSIISHANPLHTKI